MIGILIIESEGSYRETPIFMPGKGGFDVAVTAGGENGLAKCERDGTGPVLLDLMLPEIPRTEVCRRLRVCGDVMIIMVSVRDPETDKVVGLEIGADDYVTKPSSCRELVAQTRTILRCGHDTTLIPEVVEMDGVCIDVERHQVFADGQEARLVLRKLELLKLLLCNAGRVMTRGQIIDRIWGSDYVGDTETPDAYVERLCDKIGHEPSKPPRMIMVRGLGYKSQG